LPTHPETAWRQAAGYKGTLPADNSLLSLVNKRFHGISSIERCVWPQSSSTRAIPTRSPPCRVASSAPPCR
jgi:hypothetical protein